MGSRRWGNVTKIIVIVALVIITLVLLVTFRAMFSPTIVAFLLAFLLSYPVNWIQRSTGWARGGAILIVYIVLACLAALVPVVTIPRSAGLVVSLEESLNVLLVNLQNASTGPLVSLGPLQLSFDQLFAQAGDAISNILTVSTRNPVTIVTGVTTGILTIVYVMVLTFWILKDLYKLQRLVLEAIPPDYQQDARRLARELGVTWQAFLRGQLLLALTVGIMTWVALGIVGMPNAGGLAILAGIMEFLPSIGPGISGAIGVTISLIQGSTWMPVGNFTFAIIVLIIYAIIAQIETTYLIPRLVGGQVRLHPAVSFVGIITGAIVFGLLGVLLATPLIASTRILLSYVFRKLMDQDPFEEMDLPDSTVRLPGIIAGRKINGVIFDLDGTLAQIDWFFPEWAASHFAWADRVVGPEERAHVARRIMISSEGFNNFLINQARRLHVNKNIERYLPFLNRLRGFPPPSQLMPHAGIGDTLATLSMQYSLALVSTRNRREISTFLTKSHFPREALTVVLGREDVRNLLPNSEAYLSAADQLGIPPNQILVVSDSKMNLRSAGAAQMATGGVLCGLAEEQDLLEADLVVEDTNTLMEWI